MNIRGGQIIQSNGNPIFPGTQWTGPLLAGNIQRTGGANLAGLGSTDQGSLANVGYVKMTQAARVLQAAAPGFVSPDLIIPAQSLITSITSIQITAFTGAAATFGVGNTVNPIAFTPAGAMTGSQTVAIAAAVAPQLQNWLNCGPIDEQFVFTAANAGSGVMLVIIDYIQGINAPTS